MDGHGEFGGDSSRFKIGGVDNGWEIRRESTFLMLTGGFGDV